MVLFVLSVTQMLTTQADRFSSEEVNIITHQFAPKCANPEPFKCRDPCLLVKAVLLFAAQMEQMFTAFPPDMAGNLDYKNLVHIITHGEEKDQE